MSGPIGEVETACVSGKSCNVQDVQGKSLSTLDKMMVLASQDCDTASATTGFDVSTHVTTCVPADSPDPTCGFTLGVTRALGGVYRLCWCGGGYICDGPPDFRKPFGQMTVFAPSGGLSKVCDVFDATGCSISGVTGYGLIDGDRMMLLSQCGQEEPVSTRLPNGGVLGFPQDDILVATSGTYSFGADNPVISASGGIYRMCWCSKYQDVQQLISNVCASPSNFITDVGQVTVRGPERGHKFACIQGLSCALMGLRGYGFTNGDEVKIFGQYGSTTALVHDCSLDDGGVLTEPPSNFFPNNGERRIKKMLRLFSSSYGELGLDHDAKFGRSQ
jgi:hypothetical protein